MHAKTETLHFIAKCAGNSTTNSKPALAISLFLFLRVGLLTEYNSAVIVFCIGVFDYFSTIVPVAKLNKYRQLKSENNELHTHARNAVQSGSNYRDCLSYANFTPY